MRMTAVVLAAWLLVIGALLAESSAGTKCVWAVNDGERVKRDDLVNPNKASNSAWDGKVIRIFGARNEIVAFQLIVEADGKGIAALSMSLPLLTERGGDAKITYTPPAPDPADYAGRHIQLFSTNYINVTKPTKANWAFRPGSPAAPRDPLGWTPVQLVPENARKGKGGFPLAVPPASNQGFWVDLYIARDLPPGFYDGIITVRADSEKIDVPVELRVFGFALPDENTLPAMVYYEDYQPVMYQGHELDAQYDRFAHRNRVELVNSTDREKVLASIGRYDGTDFTRAKGYEGPGEGVGNHIIPASFYGPRREYRDRDTAWTRSDAWMTFLAERFPKAITFMYMQDEPGPSQFDGIRSMADNIHSNPGPGKALPVFVTTHPRPELAGCVDIWAAPVGHYDVEAGRAEQAAGRKVWVYNGGRPGGGAFVIDAPATDARATMWACFKHGIDGYYYWHGDHWRHNSQKQGERTQNVWANPITFDNQGQPNKPVRSQGWLNGDGVLMYPGEDVLHPDEDRGIPGPVSCIRMANLRRGLQDHAYLTMARALGLAKAVDSALAACVPKVFSEADDTLGFAENGNAYETERHKLAEAIEAALKSE